MPNAGKCIFKAHKLPLFVTTRRRHPRTSTVEARVASDDNVDYIAGDSALHMRDGCEDTQHAQPDQTWCAATRHVALVWKIRSIMASPCAFTVLGVLMSPPGKELVSALSAIGNDPPWVIMKKRVRSETFGIAPSFFAPRINLDIRL